MADMGLDMLDDMDVDKVADMVANMVAEKKGRPGVGHGGITGLRIF